MYFIISVFSITCTFVFTYFDVYDFLLYSYFNSGAQEVSSILETPLEKPRLYIHALTLDTTPVS